MPLVKIRILADIWRDEEKNELHNVIHRSLISLLLFLKFRLLNSLNYYILILW
jgi:hypothetical protein